MRLAALPAVLLAGLLCLLVAAAAPAPALQPVPPPALPPIPPPAGHVTDLTGALGAAPQAALERQLADFEARRGSQVAVLIVPTTQPEAIEDYAMRVAEQWKPGRRRIDDGAILVIALQDRQLRIEVGYGLEGVLPDAVARRIVDETIVPRLRAQDLPGAVSAGVDRMLRSIEGEALPPPPPAAAAPGEGWMPYLGSVAMAAWFAGALLRRLVGRPAAALLVAGAAGGGVWWLTSWPLAGLAAAGLAAVVVLIGGAGVLRGPGPPWGGGGRRGEGDRGGDGGFRGGGGGFGGGGASGRW